MGASLRSSAMARGLAPIPGEASVGGAGGGPCADVGFRSSAFRLARVFASAHGHHQEVAGQDCRSPETARGSCQAADMTNITAGQEKRSSEMARDSCQAAACDGGDLARSYNKGVRLAWRSAWQLANTMLAGGIKSIVDSAFGLATRQRGIFFIKSPVLNSGFGLATRQHGIISSSYSAFGVATRPRRIRVSSGTTSGSSSSPPAGGNALQNPTAQGECYAIFRGAAAAAPTAAGESNGNSPLCRGKCFAYFPRSVSAPAPRIGLRSARPGEISLKTGLPATDFKPGFSGTTQIVDSQNLKIRRLHQNAAACIKIRPLASASTSARAPVTKLTLKTSPRAYRNHARPCRARPWRAGRQPLQRRPALRVLPLTKPPSKYPFLQLILAPVSQGTPNFVRQQLLKIHDVHEDAISSILILMLAS